MSENYKGDYAPELFDENKPYYLLQAQEKANLTDAELRDLNKISNTYTRKFIQDQVGVAASVGSGFMIGQGNTVPDQSNNFLINPGVTYLHGYRLELTDSIRYSDQTRTADRTSLSAITTPGFTETNLSKLTTVSGASTNYYGITMVGTDVYACGDGTIIKTLDTGRNWSVLNSGYKYRAISFCNSTTGIVVGDLGLKVTINSGTGWNQGPTSSLNAVVVVDPTRAWAAGADGTVLYASTNLGAWTEVQATNPGGQTEQDLYGISTVDSINVWAVGASDGLNATLIYSVNSGTTWNFQTLPGVVCDLNAIQVVDNTSIFIVGANGTFVRSLNGTTWTSSNVGTTSNLRALYFKDKFTGWAVGDNGIIVDTTNSGTTWGVKTIASGVDLKGIVFSDTTGFISAPNGKIYRTLDGINWDLYRTDYVYIDFHLAEVSGDTASGSEYLDPGLVDSTIGLPSANRLRLVSDVKVSEGWPMPSDYTVDGTVMHYTTPIASILRNPDRTSILQSDITDLRTVVSTLLEIQQGMENGGFGTSAIADGAITPEKLQSTGDFTVGSMNITGNVVIGGDLVIQGSSVYDDVEMDNLQVNGRAILGDSSRPYDATHYIYGSVVHYYDGSATAPVYDIRVISPFDTTQVFNIDSVGSGQLFQVRRDNTDSTKNLFDIANNGGGYDLNILHTGSEGGVLNAVDDATGSSISIKKNASGSVVDVETNSASPAISIVGTAPESVSLYVNQVGGTIMSLNSSGHTLGINIESVGGSSDLRINHQGASGSPVEIISSSSQGSINVVNNDGQAVTIKHTSNTTLMSLDKTGAGLGLALEVNNRGADVGLGVYNTGSGIGQLISHVGDSTNPGFDIFVAGNETGPALRINKSNDMLGELIKLWNQGLSETILIDHDRTDSLAPAIRLNNRSLGYDISGNAWSVDGSGNIYVNSVIFDASHFITVSSMSFDYSGFDTSNSGVAGEVFLDSNFLRMSMGPTPLPPPGFGGGSTGIQGVTGLGGVTGIAGVGFTGLRGIDGATGIVGPMGLMGDQGFTGIEGPQGVTGLVGLGVTGLAGIQGFTGMGGGGETGPQGLRGFTGISATVGLTATITFVE